MLPILSADQIRQLDAYTIRHEPIDSIDLMERASQAFVDWFVAKFSSNAAVGIVCGTGNNGGDGLAIARLLTRHHYTVAVWVVRSDGRETEDFGVNFKRLPKKSFASDITTDNEIPSFDSCDILIDALFGSGLSRPVSGVFESVINAMNQSKATRVAVDIPSGLFADRPGNGAVVKARYTVSFQLPKLVFMLPQYAGDIGEWQCVDIGLSRAFLTTATVRHQVVEEEDVAAWLKPRRKFDHKGTYGRALLVSGSLGKMGAAVLAARAVMRSGAGLLTVHIPQCGQIILQSAVPEAMVSLDSGEAHTSHIPQVENADAVGLGPGLGLQEQTRRALEEFLSKAAKPVVLDADALNLLARDRKMLKLLPPSSILTPHPGEFERLVGTWRDDFHRLELQQEFSRTHRCIVVLKGAHTSTTAPDGNVYFNSTGNPGMATAGSGDVLTGIVTSLLAQGYEPIKAAILAVFLHGMAGDLASLKVGMRSLVASDLIDFLPQAYRYLEDNLKNG